MKCETLIQFSFVTRQNLKVKMNKIKQMGESIGNEKRGY